MFTTIRSRSLRQHPASRGYPDHMPVHAHDIAVELRERLPALPSKKLHKLLYYCQGHHAAATGTRLFQETISAWDMGPVVGQLWHQQDRDTPAPPRTALSESQLNTIGYVLSRYGQLTGKDLEHLTHAEDPWRRANETREPGGSSRIEWSWLEEYFRQEAHDERLESGGPDPTELNDMLEGAEKRLGDNLGSDSYEALRARLTGAR